MSFRLTRSSRTASQPLAVRATALAPLLAAAVIACALAAPGCKGKKVVHKRSTPVETINSFRRALETGRIPADTSDFFLDKNQKVAWKLRCKERGCNRARFKINEVVSEDQYAAKYMIDYTIYGTGNRRIMGGTNTPVTFAFHDGSWYFDQIGVVHTIPIGKPPAPAVEVPAEPGGDPDPASGSGATPTDPAE